MNMDGDSPDPVSLDPQLMDLPNEILMNILHWVPPQYTSHFARTCKRARRLAEAASLWEYYFRRHFAAIDPPSFEVLASGFEWRRLYGFMIVNGHLLGRWSYHKSNHGAPAIVMKVAVEQSTGDFVGAIRNHANKPPLLRITCQLSDNGTIEMFARYHTAWFPRQEQFARGPYDGSTTQGGRRTVSFHGRDWQLCTMRLFGKNMLELRMDDMQPLIWEKIN